MQISMVLDLMYHILDNATLSEKKEGCGSLVWHPSCKTKLDIIVRQGCMTRPREMAHAMGAQRVLVADQRLAAMAAKRGVDKLQQLL